MVKIPSYRLQLGGVAVLSAVALGVLSVIVHPGFLTQHCGVDVKLFDDCSRLWSEIIDGGFYSGFFLKAIVIVSVLLMFLPERAYKWWRWFALISIPLAVWNIATTKTVLAMVGTSPRFTSDIDGELFISLSVIVATFALLFGKIRGHHFAKSISLYASYLIAILFSFGLGAVTLWAIWH